MIVIDVVFSSHNWCCPGVQIKTIFISKFFNFDNIFNFSLAKKALNNHTGLERDKAHVQIYN